MNQTQVPPTTTTTVTTTTGDEGPRRSRLGKALAIAALAAPLALGAAIALHPEDTTDAADTLGRIAGDDRARWALAHVLEPAAWVALAVVFLGIRALPLGRGRLPVRVGASLAAVGATAISMIVYAHGEAYLHMSAEGIDTGTMHDLYTRFQEEMPLVAPLSVGFQLGLLVLGVGLFRSRLVPRWAAGAVALTPAVMAALSTAPVTVTALGVLPLAAALATTAPVLRGGAAS